VALCSYVYRARMSRGPSSGAAQGLLVGALLSPSLALPAIAASTSAAISSSRRDNRENSSRLVWSVASLLIRSQSAASMRSFSNFAFMSLIIPLLHWLSGSECSEVYIRCPAQRFRCIGTACLHCRTRNGGNICCSAASSDFQEEAIRRRTSWALEEVHC